MKQLELWSIPKMFIKPRILLVFHFRFNDTLMANALNLNVRRIPGNIYLNLVLLALMGIPASLLSMFLVNWRYAGRRITCAMAMLSAGICSFLVLPVSATGTVHCHSTEQSILILAFGYCVPSPHFWFLFGNYCVKLDKMLHRFYAFTVARYMQV